MNELLCENCGAATSGCGCPWYVNVYLHTQQRGGPEEGGWYYYAGEPVESRRVHSANEAEAAQHVLTAWYASDNENLRREFWTKYDSYQVVIEHHFARAYPDHIPHYE